MKILLLAPHPFYQERGTPIAADLLLQALSRAGYQVDVLTYAEGLPRAYAGVRILRLPRLPGIRNIPPGFSLKKVICDVFLLFKAWRLVARRRYQLVHAIEESAFIALGLRRCYGIPYIFDMDSSMPQQLMDKNRLFRLLGPGLKMMEKWAVRGALAVVPMCDALAAQAAAYKPHKVFVLRDISLLPVAAGVVPQSLRHALHIEGLCFMYVGNLQPYQGVDLLLESFARLLKDPVPVDLVIVGGTPGDVRRYRAKTRKLDIERRTIFMGHQPVNILAGLFACADVLVSPRLRGQNTPMKIYSYMQSGKPILATDLPTHTQVLTPDIAVLVPPDPAQFAAGMRKLIKHPEWRATLAHRAKAVADERYSLPVFERTVRDIYAWIETQIQPPNSS